MSFARKNEISEKQSELYVYIVRHVEQYGYQPSKTEMAEHFGVTNKAIGDRILQLANKGYIELPPKHSDRCVRLKHVTFRATLAEHEPEPPVTKTEPNPVTGPIIRDTLVRYFKNRNNRPATVAELAAENGFMVNKVYPALQHAPTGMFERVSSEGSVQRWRLHPSYLQMSGSE